MKTEKFQLVFINEYLDQNSELYRKIPSSNLIGNFRFLSWEISDISFDQSNFDSKFRNFLVFPSISRLSIKMICKKLVLRISFTNLSTTFKIFYLISIWWHVPKSWIIVSWVFLRGRIIRISISVSSHLRRISIVRWQSRRWVAAMVVL